MHFTEFKKVNEHLWHEYFTMIFRSILSKNISLQDGGNIIFANIILFTETKEHFILELLGGNRGYTKFVTKTHKEVSTSKYLYQFEFEDNYNNVDSSLFLIEGRGAGLINILFSRPVDFKKLKERFHFYDRWGTKMIRNRGVDGPLISFSKDFKSLFIEDSLIVNNFEEIYRVKHIGHMIIVNKNYHIKDFEHELKNRLQWPVNNTNELFGVKYCKNSRAEKELLSGQFVSTFLIPGLRETTIGEFINKNPSFIKDALSCEDFLYEKEFIWFEGNPDTNEKFINPDLLIKRKDSYFDLLDLKTPKLNHKKLTLGYHKRRRFYDYIDEGLAQLANYEEYFTFTANSNYAKKEFNVEVKEPILYLIVGNYENLSSEELREASRHLKPNYRIIDYDTLNALFLNSN